VFNTGEKQGKAGFLRKERQIEQRGKEKNHLFQTDGLFLACRKTSKIQKSFSRSKSYAFWHSLISANLCL